MMKLNFKIINRFLIVLFCLVLYSFAYTQNPEIDTIKEFPKKQFKINTQDKKGLTIENDTGVYERIMISGYIQAQFEDYQQDLVEPFDPLNTFYIRRARIKFTYEAFEGITFVLQSDFSKGNLPLKDAYAELSLPKLKNITLSAGKFRRPSYESEYGSSEKEILERSNVLKSIYPDQRDIGIKLQYKSTNLPLKLQIALMNGNLNEKQTNDVDTRKDIMALAMYSIAIPSPGISIDFGMNFYSGGIRVKSTNFISGSTGAIDSIALGDYLNKKWISGEIQIFMDFLGGIALKGEFLKGINAYDVSNSSPASITNPYKVRYFSGFYIYFIKYVGSKNRFIARYDYFDPNTKVAGDVAIKDVYYKTFAFAWEYFLNDHIGFALSYELPKNEINSEVNRELKDNIFKARIQVKF
ncbi:MAG: hypothetical protein A2V64_04985 [Bacteroidetes bacterium RBG_13_43_22]|nr:MAG: hypothetical protein A2V64_04985 [Bacteroidetes bacterium RBG_13_43_22]